MSEEMKPMFDGTIVTLIDEDGKELVFEHIDTVEIDGVTYVALVPAFDNPEEYVDSDGALELMKMVPSDEDPEESILTSIDDEEEFDKVAAAFEERLSEDFDII